MEEKPNNIIFTTTDGFPIYIGDRYNTIEEDRIVHWLCEEEDPIPVGNTYKDIEIARYIKINGHYPKYNVHKLYVEDRDDVKNQFKIRGQSLIDYYHEARLEFINKILVNSLDKLPENKVIFENLLRVYDQMVKKIKDSNNINAFYQLINDINTYNKQQIKSGSYKVIQMNLSKVFYKYEFDYTISLFDLNTRTQDDNYTIHCISSFDNLDEFYDKFRDVYKSILIN